MHLIRKTSKDRILDASRLALTGRASLDVASPSLCPFASSELRTLMQRLSSCRTALPRSKSSSLNILATEADRALRNPLLAQAPARQCAQSTASLRLDDHAGHHVPALYQGWINRCDAYLAGPLSGSLTRATNTQATARRRAALPNYERPSSQVIAPSIRTSREAPLHGRMDLNANVKRHEAERAQTPATP